MRFSFFVLPLVVLMINVDDTESLNTTKRYFLTIDVCGSVRGLRQIENILCNTRPRRYSENSVTCFLKFMIVGESRVIVVVDVLNSIELERRLRVLLSLCKSFRYESEPIVDYETFATQILGVDPALAKLEGNTLENIPEALWCEFNINFGDKNASEILSLWKQEAEVTLQTRRSGIPTEIFKLLGERTVHLLIELDATMFDQILFGTPFNQQIPNTLTTTCKTIVSVENYLQQMASDKRNY